MILLFSGPAAAGKSSICLLLEEQQQFVPIKSSIYLRSIVEKSGDQVTRDVLQQTGDRLDTQTDYNWLIESVAKPQMATRPEHDRWYVDSVRKREQIGRFVVAFPGQIFHVHVTAPDDILRSRLLQRSTTDRGANYEKSFDEHILHPNEIAARSLGDIADLVIDTSINDAREARDNIVRKVL